MKKVTYVLIPGLWDQRPLFGWFYYLMAKWWSMLGMPSVVCQMKWISPEAYDEKKARMDACIIKLTQAGREVVLVGVSAGGPMAIVGLAEWPSVVAAVVISGLLVLSKEERKNPLYASTSWGEASGQSERTLKKLTPQQRARVLTLSGKKDDIINPRREHLEGGMQRHTRGHSHLPTVVKIMIFRPLHIKRFIEGLH
jgi:pimeloyl-ACP methyl ester carboxylesterase